MTKHYNYPQSFKLDLDISQNLDNLLISNQANSFYLDSKSCRLLEEPLYFEKFDNFDMYEMPKEMLIAIIEIMKKERIDLINLFNQVNDERMTLRVNNLKLLERLFAFENFSITKFDSDFMAFCNKCLNLHYELLKKVIEKEQETNKKLEAMLIDKDEEIKRIKAQINFPKKPENFKRSIIGDQLSKDTLYILDPIEEENPIIKDIILNTPRSTMCRFGDASQPYIPTTKDQNQNDLDQLGKTPKKFLDPIIGSSPKNSEGFDDEIMNSIHDKWKKKMMEIKEKQKFATPIPNPNQSCDDKGINISKRISCPPIPELKKENKISETTTMPSQQSLVPATPTTSNNNNTNNNTNILTRCETSPRYLTTFADVLKSSSSAAFESKVPNGKGTELPSTSRPHLNPETSSDPSLATESKNPIPSRTSIPAISKTSKINPNPKELTNHNASLMKKKPSNTNLSFTTNNNNNANNKNNGKGAVNSSMIINSNHNDDIRKANNNTTTNNKFPNQKPLAKVSSCKNFETTEKKFGTKNNENCTTKNSSQYSQLSIKDNIRFSDLLDVSRDSCQDLSDSILRDLDSENLQAKLGNAHRDLKPKDKFIKPEASQASKTSISTNINTNTNTNTKVNLSNSVQLTRGELKTIAINTNPVTVVKKVKK